MTDMATIEISYPMQNGTADVDADSQNPLVRSLLPLMELDKLLPSIRLIFLTEERGTPRWLGVFVRSAGGRILFFPGLDIDLIRVRGTEEGAVRFDKEICLDHISLEKDLETWHITSPMSKAHQGGPAALEIGDGRVLWAGMAIQDLSVLKVARQKTVATFRVKDKATEHKIRQLQGAIATGDSVMIPLLSKPADGLWFPLISIVVGPKGFPVYRGPHWGAPYGSEYVTGELAPDQKFRHTGNQFPLDENMDVQVAATWIPGKMAIPLIFTSPKPDVGQADVR